MVRELMRHHLPSSIFHLSPDMPVPELSFEHVISKHICLADQAVAVPAVDAAAAADVVAADAGRPETGARVDVPPCTSTTG